MWLVRPGVSATPMLSFDVSGHEERGGHTWYQLKVCLEVSAAPLRWTSERRLSTLREELHDRVKDVLGQNYAAHFSKTPFALKGGLPGTTARLTAWFGALAKVVNKGEAPPSLVALLLQFLEAPDPPDPEPEEDVAKIYMEKEENSSSKEPVPRKDVPDVPEVLEASKPPDESELAEIEISLSE